MTGEHYAGFSVQGHILSTAGTPLKSFLFVCKTIQIILEGSGQPEFVTLIETCIRKLESKTNLSRLLSSRAMSPHSFPLLKFHQSIEKLFCLINCYCRKNLRSSIHHFPADSVCSWNQRPNTNPSAPYANQASTKPDGYLQFFTSICIKCYSLIL